MRQKSDLQDVPARYLEIADILHHEIVNGSYTLHERLPSEAQLCSRFRENRYTIRQALDVLLHKGVIRSHQGKGHYVCEKPLNLQYTITPNTRFSNEITLMGCTPKAKLLKQEKLIPPEEIAAALKLDPLDEVYRLEILRYADSIPLAWNVTWLPDKFFPDLLNHTRCLGSLYAMLENVYGMQLHRILSTFQAAYPTALEASYLKIPPNANLLHIESVMRDSEMRLVEFTSAKYRGDLCRVSIELEQK